jgi:cell division septum initiation protein DivIVA
MHGDLSETVPDFKRVLRGFDPLEVQAWAAQAAATIAQLRAALEEARSERDQQRSAQHELVRTMTSAHLMAERLVEETQSEAARRKSAAVEEADRMLAVARHEAHETVAIARAEARRELSALEVERAGIVSELASLRGLLHDERVRARDGLAATLRALDDALGTPPATAAAYDVTVVDRVPALSVVAS